VVSPAGSAERDASGKIVRMAGSIQDINREKEAEDALREAQARFDRAVKGTQDGLWEADVRASMWLSPRAHALLGYAEGELHQRLDVLRERVHPDDLPANDEALRITLELVINLHPDVPANVVGDPQEASMPTSRVRS
jgi:PAS domain-containing protein